MLLQIVSNLIEGNVSFRLHLLGQQFRQQPEEMEKVINLLENNNRLGQVGFIDSRDDYLSVLKQSTIVLSTSRHEFQGLAVQEAMSVGCLPVVPDALCYPEYVPDEFRYGSVAQAVRIISAILDQQLPHDIQLDQYRWEAVGPKWLNQIADLTDSA